MSAAEELRRAAEVLRERARSATPGPWHVLHESAYYQPSVGTRLASPEALDSGEWVAECDSVDRLGGESADYIATVSPDVGLLLADLLDALARDRELDPYLGKPFDEEALNLARAINRGQP